MRKLADGRGLLRISPTSAGIISGELDLSEWDDEELIRGRRRSKRGTWEGKPPTVVPSAVHQELTRRRFQRAFDLLSDSLVDAAQMLRSIVNDIEASPSDRIRAGEVLMNRVLGKPKESVALDLSGDSEPWKRMIAAAIVGTEEQAREIVDAEIVREDDASDEEILDDTQSRPDD